MVLKAQPCLKCSVLEVVSECDGWTFLGVLSRVRRFGDSASLGEKSGVYRWDIYIYIRLDFI